MNQNNFVGIALDELYRIFDILNKNYFSNKLLYPMITIQKTKHAGNLGWFTLDKIWENKEATDKRYEINICAEYLNQDIYTIVDTLQHEMVHYANKIAEIKDCNGQVHNKKFKTLAESVGLLVEKSKKYGYGHTSCSDEFKKFINDKIKPNTECFAYFRNLFIKEQKIAREKRTFKALHISLHLSKVCTFFGVSPNGDFRIDSLINSILLSKPVNSTILYFSCSANSISLNETSLPYSPK
jgi:phosphopantetheinyl transferase (holo-ACP synthase)